MKHCSPIVDHANILQAHLLLTCINFNPSMDSELHPLYSVGRDYFSFTKLEYSAAIEDWE